MRPIWKNPLKGTLLLQQQPVHSTTSYKFIEANCTRARPRSFFRTDPQRFERSSKGVHLSSLPKKKERKDRSFWMESKEKRIRLKAASPFLPLHFRGSKFIKRILLPIFLVSLIHSRPQSLSKTLQESKMSNRTSSPCNFFQNIRVST